MSSYLAWPALIAAFTLAVTIGVGAGTVGFVLAAAAITVVLLLLEWWRPLDREREAMNDPQLGYDVGHNAVANGIAQLTDAAALFAGAVLATRLRDGVGLALWPSGASLVAQGALVVLVADGLEYWRHRTLHRVSWLWPVHALHHSVDRLHALKGPRLTFVDMVIRSVVVYAPLAALGAPPEALVSYPATLLVLGPISHANLDFRFPSFLHRVVVTPPEHRVHHALDPALADGNFAPVLPLWDLVFGTYRHPTALPPAVGILRDPMPAAFVPQVLSPFLWRRFG